MPHATVDLSERLCQSCGYNLRGLETNRCPECGEAFDPRRMPAAKIPWLARRALGNWQAYWQTVGMAMFHPRRLGGEVWNSLSVDPRGASAFRRAILYQLAACIAIVVGVFFWTQLHGHIVSQYKEVLAALVLTPGGVSVFVLLASDSGSLRGLLDPDELWRRALRQYACAPLAAAPLVGLIEIGAIQFNNAFELMAVPALLIMLGWWWASNVLIMHASRPSVANSVGHALMLPLWWMMCAFTTILITLAAGSILIAALSILP